MKEIVNIAGYKFIKLENLPQWQDLLKTTCKQFNLKGTILLAPEGINVMLAGTQAGITEFTTLLQKQVPFADLTYKTSYSETMPFKRLLIKIKREIIAFGVPNIDPATFTAPRLSAQVFKQWLDEGKDIAVLDTRNKCEVEMGTFANALDLDINHFRTFPAAVQKLDDEIKQKPVVTFCTGGVRCEKAAAYMLEQGFREVYQLDGGILQYFAECGSAHFVGNCFVFDERISVDGQLQPVYTNAE